MIELFDNPDNLYNWQAGLQSFEHQSGTPGQPGATSLLVYLNGKHRIELTETIIENKLPDEFDGEYSWKGGSNTLHNRFIELGPNSTRWESTCAYDMKGVFMKVMGRLFAGKFRAQNLKFLENFKAFCEDGFDVRKSG